VSVLDAFYEVSDCFYFVLLAELVDSFVEVQNNWVHLGYFKGSDCAFLYELFEDSISLGLVTLGE